MPVRIQRFWMSVCFLALIALLAAPFPRGVATAAQLQAPSALTPVVTTSSRNDTSPPLSQMAGGLNTPQGNAKSQAVLSRALPRDAHENAATFGDAALQSIPLGMAPMPATIANFDGVSNIDGVLPPDTNGDVGPNHYMQWVNLSLAIWNKSGTLLLGPVAGNTLWNGFGGVCEADNDGDPIVLYDHLADRWMVSQFAVPTNDYHECIAVSATGDPLGAWHRYDFFYGSAKFNDYPHFGVWPDGYYATYNQFDSSDNWAGAGVVAYERSQMLNGQPARQIYFDLFAVSDAFGGMLPADLDGPAPPAGTPAIFAEADDSTFFAGLAADRVALWQFSANWTNPALSTFGVSGNPNESIAVANFEADVCANFARACVPQQGTTAKLDAISDRLMHRVQYRNFGTHQTLVMNHTVDAGGNVAAPRWYEMRKATGAGTWSLNQQSTFAPDTTHRWMGSIAMDGQGNMALGYSASSTAMFPAIKYAGRLSGDPLNTLPQTESTLMAGGGAQTSSSSRWGDYSAMGLDPVDQCTFWYTSEYYATTGSATWRTRIGSFKFPSCTPVPGGIISGTVTIAGGGPLANATVSLGAYSTLTDSAGHYKILNVPAGSYTATASHYGYTSQSAAVTITANTTTIQNFALNPLPSAIISGKVTDDGHGWPLYARISVNGNLAGPVFTNPATGQYSISLLLTQSYTLTVEAVLPGYTAATRGITVVGAATENFVLAHNTATCDAPGYAYAGVALNESFNQPTLPSGWSNIDNVAGHNPAQAWSFNDPGGEGNLTGGSGGFAILDSDFYGQGQAQDAELRTPSLNLTGMPVASLQFDTDFRRNATEVADVDIQVNGGAWTNVWRKTGVSHRGPKHEVVDISALAGNQANVVIRFRYSVATWEWWWEIDNVRVGNITCAVQSGGLLAGYVTDQVTGLPVVGATVRSVDAPSSQTTSFATPEDTNAPDGLYILFSGLTGAHPFAASKATPGYGTDTDSVTVVANNTVRHDFALPSAKLSAPAQVDVTLPMSQTTSRVLTLSNTGGISATFSVAEVNAPYTGTLANVPGFASNTRHVGPPALSSLSGSVLRIYNPPAAAPLAAGSVLSQFNTNLDYGWGLGYNTASGDLWLSNVAAGGGDDRNYAFSTSGTPTGKTVSTGSDTDWGADMAYNPFTGKMWQATGAGNGCVFSFDPASRQQGASVCPLFGTTERGLAYDPTTNTFYSGSWNDGIINHFAADGTLIDSLNVNIAIAGLAYNPATGHLFVSANYNPANAPSGKDFYVLDVNAGYSVVGAFMLGENVAGDLQGLEIDCNGHLWLAAKHGSVVYEVDSGESGVCAWQNIPWLTVTPSGGTINANGTTNLTLNFDSTGLAVGTYEGHLRITSSSPHGDVVVKVILNVTPAGSTLKVIYLPRIVK
jgi:hypothetical protein